MHKISGKAAPFHDHFRRDNAHAGTGQREYTGKNQEVIMITKLMEIKIPTGLDPSTIALFIQTASQYESRVYVEVENKKVNAKSIMGMMTLGLPAGEKITVSAVGEDEEAAIEHIEQYLSNEKIG